MRVSTNTMYSAGVARMNELQTSLLKTQQQVATGRRILTPADDPLGAAQALNLSQGQSMNTQFAANRSHAKSALMQEEGVLQSVTSLIQDVKDAIIQAGNPTLGDGERQFVATDLRSRLDELMGLANSRDGLGNFMFGGNQIDSAPFSKTGNGAHYKGDQGRPMLQVDSARRMAVGDSGESVFMQIPAQGNFTASSTDGGLQLSPVTVADASSLNLEATRYDIKFSRSGGATHYEISVQPVTVPASPAMTGVLTPGEPIHFEGRQLSIEGTPDDGSIVSIRASTRDSLFSTLGDVIDLLEMPGSGQLGGANLSHGLSVANGNIDRALDHVLAVRASVGSRLKEVDTLDNAGLDKNLQYEQAISTIQDLDYNQALSDLARQQVILQAAQQSFVKVSGLSLFNFL